MAASRKKGLGKGLSALLSDKAPVSAAAESNSAENISDSEQSGSRTKLPIDFLVRNPKQPRVHFDDTALNELKASIAEKGVLQPILVRKLSDERYEIVAGERRWRAAQKAGIHDVPVVVLELTDTEVLEIGLIENIQRKDLTPIEEAIGYQRLTQEFAHTQDDISKLVGKSRSHIANLLRLLTLPDAVQTLVNDGALSMGHARALIGAADAISLAQKVVRDGLSVRQTEELAGSAKGIRKREPRPGGLQGGLQNGKNKPKDADTLALEKALSDSIGLPVSIDHTGEKGTVSLNFTSLDQLDDICARLGVADL